jgi:hypothetical protein
MKSQAPEKLPFPLLIVFALGQFGWSLASFSVANLLTYFYMPPENNAGQGLFPALIPQGAVLGSLTLLGLLAFSSRLWRFSRRSSSRRPMRASARRTSFGSR